MRVGDAHLLWRLSQELRVSHPGISTATHLTSFAQQVIAFAEKYVLVVPPLDLMHSDYACWATNKTWATAFM